MTLSPIELALPSPPFPAGRRVTLLPGFLSRAESSGLVARAEARGFRASSPEYPPSYRSNDRQVIDDPEMARTLFERLSGHVPAEMTGRDGERFRVFGLNERFRVCRYRAGQSFGTHRDGVHFRSRDVQSLLTFMIYLNDADEFSGGLTRFFPERASPGSAAVTVTPRAGMLIVFEHDLWHDGATVGSGVKYVLRSDILYRREAGTELVS